MNTNEILDKLAAQFELKSDYQIAKHLHISTQRVSRYRRGLDTLGDQLAVEVADQLGIDRCFIMASMAAERAKSPDVKRTWAQLAARIGGMAAAVLIAYFAVPLLDYGTANDALASSSTVYYVK
jgi:hypothetical protein